MTQRHQDTMLNPLNLLTSIKPPAINPVNEVRPVGPLQGDPRQGFSGLLQQAAQQATQHATQHATQQRANQPPPVPQANRPTAPRPTAQATAPRPQPAPAQKPPAASAPPAQAQRPASAERARPAQQDATAGPDSADGQRGTTRQTGASAADAVSDPAARRDDGNTAARTERSVLDALWDRMGQGQVDPQALTHALGETAGEWLDADTQAELEAAEQAVADGTLLPGIDTLALPSPSHVTADPSVAATLASSLAALAQGQPETGADEAAGVSAGAAGDGTIDLATTGNAAAHDTSGQGGIELAEDTALATHESFQQALVESQMPGDDTAAMATVRQAGAAGPAAAAEPGATGPGAAHPVHGAALPSASPTAASSASPAAAATNAAGYALGTPVDSPDFPQAMATQISYFVREGIQQAQLHLNPAEMGPVSVQIALNGQQAQVDFAAASSATRAAIENSLSDLAASLQSAGFTLTGGGVSQQSQQSQQSPQQASGQAGNEARPGQRHGQGDAVEAAGTQTVLHHRSTAGGLDLYA